MAAIVHHVLQHGWKVSQNVGQSSAPTSLACMHLMRERIFYEVLKNSYRYYNIWDMLEDQESYSLTPPQQVLDDMKTGPTKFHRFREIALRLDAHRRRGCCSCIHDKDGYQHDFGETVQDNPSRHGHLYDIAAPQRIQSTAVEAIPLHTTNYNSPAPSVNDCLDDFDDYDSAPVQRTQDIGLGNTWSFDGYGNFMLETCWSTWIDYGFRLQPRFFSMFPDDVPAQHSEHLLPTTKMEKPSSYDTESSGTSSSSWFTNSTMISISDNSIPPTIQISTPDPPNLVLGLQGMLDEAGPVANTPESQNVFVCGKDRTGEFFLVDPTKDEIKVSAEETSISPDLDSLIYVTHRLKFRGAMHLHLLPLMGSRAPFWKTNHVTVKVLCPPAEAGSRSHRTKAYTLNQIPHTHFGQLGTGAVLFNVYVFFPRMIQKHPTRNYMLNMLPLPVQNLWLDSGVIPATREVFCNDFPGTTEYVPWSLEQLRLKKGGDRGPKTLVTSPDCLLRLQEVLRSRIQHNPDLLQRFGSFFFVVDSRGIKLLSKQYALQTQPQDVLQNMLPFLDLTHMMDRNHGELILDLGISYHPPMHQPMIGLWKLAEVCTSYDVMGTRKGRTHHACTLDGYGGRQAPMGKARKMHTQLLSRSTYNLVFEVIRAGGQVQYLCSDADAIKASDRYMRACQAWKDLFQQAACKSFGVREEIRGSAAAIFDLFCIVSVKVTLMI
jgi:hypothetical protein